MSDYPMLISNKLHSFRNFASQIYYSYIQTSNRKQEKEHAINVYYRKTM